MSFNLTGFVVYPVTFIWGTHSFLRLEWEYSLSLYLFQESEDVGAKASCWPQRPFVLRCAAREAQGAWRRGRRCRSQRRGRREHRGGDCHQTGRGVQLCESPSIIHSTPNISISSRLHVLWLSFLLCAVMFQSNLFQEEQDIKALQTKNRKLGESLDQRQVNSLPGVILRL